MTDYDNRWFKTGLYCPRCFLRYPQRLSIIERQKWGGKDFRYRCSDYSYCDWVRISDSVGPGDSLGLDMKDL